MIKLSFVLLISLLCLHRGTNAACPDGRIKVSGATNDADFKVNGVYYLQSGTICDSAIVYRSEDITPTRYIYADAGDKNWAVGYDLCDRQENTHYLRSLKGGNVVDSPDEIPTGTWQEKDLTANKHSDNAAVKVECFSPSHPVVASSRCTSFEFILSGTGTDYDGQYMIDFTPCTGTNNRFVWKSIGLTPVKYIYYDGDGEWWAASEKKCSKTESDQQLVSFSDAEKWEDTLLWEKRYTYSGDGKQYYSIVSVTFECLPRTCMEWGAWTADNAAVCDRPNCNPITPNMCYSVCGGCGRTPSTRTCTKGTRNPIRGVFGSTESGVLPCNTRRCDMGNFYEKYMYIAYRRRNNRIGRHYKLRRCCTDNWRGKCTRMP